MKGSAGVNRRQSQSITVSPSAARRGDPSSAVTPVAAGKELGKYPLFSPATIRKGMIYVSVMPKLICVNWSCNRSVKHIGS